MSKYKTTKKECEDSINKDYVCERCGRTPIAMKTVDNSGDPTYWAGCWHADKPTKNSWGHFTHGVPKHIFEMSEKLVCQEGAYYSHMNSSEYKNTQEEREYWFESQQAGWSSILRTIEYLKNNPARKTKKEVLEDKYF